MADGRATSDKILHLLKTRGEQTSRQLADSLSLTSMGARQHLLQLKSKGWVRSAERSKQVGRPAQYWGLTEAGHEQFPDAHDTFSVSLIESVRSTFGESGLAQLIAERESRIAQQHQAEFDSDATTEQRLQRLCDWRRSEGYMAEWRKTEEGRYLFIENHCPICSAASSCQSLCQSELSLFRRFLGPDVEVNRVEHILDGARRCCYRICSREGSGH